MSNVTEATTTINWAGQSGTEYNYWIHPIGTSFANKPGNYIWAKPAKPNYWTPVYIGQTDDLGQRLSNHEKEASAKRQGATHIHAHINNGGEKARLAEERDLILRWKPVCNDQLT